MRCSLDPVKRKHPHARGEDCVPTVILASVIETPPRTWGRHYIYGDGKRDVGNTPTHVGKTSFARFVNNSWRKHPHARGEDKKYVRDGHAEVETPPRTWGRP